MEDILFDALKIDDFKEASEIYEKAKIILSKLDDDEIKKNWDEIKRKLLEDIKQKKFMEKAEKVILEVSKLKESFQFKELKEKLTSLLKEFNDNGITEYLAEIKRVQNDILNAEKDYKNKVQKIEKLKDEIKKLQEEKHFDIAVSKCESIIEIAKSIKNDEIIDEYSKLILTAKHTLKLEELQNLIKNLNKEGLVLLRKGDFSSSLDKFKMIQKSLKNYIG